MISPVYTGGVSASTTAEIISVLDGFANGELPTESTVAVLSDLDRSDIQELAGRWPSIVPELRVGILALAVDLAESQVDKDFQRLAYIAIDDPIPGVREAGFYLLNDLGGRETARRMADVLEKETNAEVVGAAAEAAAPYVLQHELGQLGEAGERLETALRKHATASTYPAETFASLVQALGYLQEQWVSELIRDAAYRDERQPQLSAIVAMGRSADEEWLDPLEQYLQSSDAEIRQRAVQACGEIGSEDAVDMIAPLLDDEHNDVVAATLAALAEIGGGDALQHLNSFYDRVPAELEDTLQEAAEAASNVIHTLSSIEPEDDD